MFLKFQIVSFSLYFYFTRTETLNYVNQNNSWKNEDIQNLLTSMYQQTNIIRALAWPHRTQLRQGE